jgi:translation elongation factor EF-Tu-like GTPase
MSWIRVRLQAQLRSLFPEEGGSRYPFFNGYRCLLHYDTDPDELVHDVEVQYDGDKFYPGQSGLVEIEPLHPEYHDAPAGKTFELRDGVRKRAIGKFTGITTTAVIQTRK